MPLRPVTQSVVATGDNSVEQRTNIDRFLGATCHDRLSPFSDRVSAAFSGRSRLRQEGWHIDADPPSWGPEAKTFSFFLYKPGRERVLCILAVDALENAAQSSDLSEPDLRRIFGAHRQMIELRAAQKLNAGLIDSNGSVQIGADDI
jgi:hypothetical protein